MKFTGTSNYVATQDLMLSVNAAITLQRPLLVKGEPGTGKTMLAEEVSEALGMPLSWIEALREGQPVPDAHRIGSAGGGCTGPSAARDRAALAVH